MAVGATWGVSVLLLILGGAAARWADFVDSAIAAVHAQAPPLPRAPPADVPAHCSHSAELHQYRRSLEFIVSDWLTMAPTRTPNAGMTAAERGDELDAFVSRVFGLADIGVLLRWGCDEAQTSLMLFDLVLKGDATVIGSFPGSPVLSWHAVVVSEWPILGLTAQVLRLEAHALAARAGLDGAAAPVALGGPSGRGACGRFLERVPAPPFDGRELLRESLELLEDTQAYTASGECALAAAVSLAVLVQGAPREQAVAAAGAAAALLAQLGSFGGPAPRAALYFLLDRALTCAAWVEVASPAGRRFPLRLPAKREHVADRIRVFRNSHCGVEHHSALHLEAELARIASGRQAGADVVVVEVGPGLGGCLLPLLLMETVSPRAVAVEPSRHVARLLAESLDRNGVAERARVVPALVKARTSDGESAHFSYDMGHITIGTPDADSLGQPRAQGTGDLRYRQGEQVAVRQLHEVLGPARVDLLLVYPEDLCSALERGELPSVRCRARLGRPSVGHCAWEDCVSGEPP